MKHARTNMTMNTKRRLMTLGLLLVTLPGCVKTPGSQLIGRWQGRPEAVQDRQKGKADAKAKTTQTVLEKFDFTMTLDFVDSSRVRMVLDQAGQSQTKSGTWRVVSSSAWNVTIEISLASPEPEGASEATNGAVRQFSLEFDDKKKSRFRLTEVNADTALGAILFERNSSE